MPRASINYNLAIINPGLAEQWHPTKNKNIFPKNVAPSSHRIVWWICNKNHVWQATVNHRASRKRGCPFCSGSKVSSKNSLIVVNPILAKEWCKSGNGKLTPKNVSYGSNKQIWWRCKNNKKHVWHATVGDRSIKSRGCPYCAGKRVSKDNCLATRNPQLSKEWHSTKNEELKPTDVMAGSDKKAWWQCKKHKRHVWLATIKSRNHGSSCPLCHGYLPNFSDKEHEYFY